MKIPTSHGMWLVEYQFGQIRYFCQDKKNRSFWNPMYDYKREIPKTVKKKALCFIREPDRFGEVVWGR